MTLTTAEDLYGIKHRVDCENRKKCQVDIVTLTDKSKEGPKKQVFFSGALHGDEVIGPNSVFYFIEYFLSNKNDTIQKHILENIEIMMTPMTNAVGYFYKEREERLSESG